MKTTTLEVIKHYNLDKTTLFYCREYKKDIIVICRGDMWFDNGSILLFRYNEVIDFSNYQLKIIKATSYKILSEPDD